MQTYNIIMRTNYLEFRGLQYIIFMLYADLLYNYADKLYKISWTSIYNICVNKMTMKIGVKIEIYIPQGNLSSLTGGIPCATKKSRKKGIFYMIGHVTCVT